MSDNVIRELRRSPGSATGLSLQDGELVRSVADLPEHRVEIHAFTNGDAATAFIDGLSIAARGNALCWSWEKGTSAVNRHVVVAWLDEARPAGQIVGDVVKIVAHDGRGHDQAAHREAMARIHQERDERDAIDLRAMAPLDAVIMAAGLKGQSGAMRWRRIDGVLISFEQNVYAVSMDVPQRNPNLPVDYQAIADAHGLRLEDDGHHFRCGPFGSPDEAVAAIGRFKAAEEAIDLTQKTQARALFEASMKMTPSRREFLESADRTGIIVGYNRGSVYARAGRRELKASELQNFVRMGWLTRDGHTGAAITDKGREAAGIEAPAPTMSS